MCGCYVVTSCQLRFHLYAVLVKLIKSVTDVWMLRGQVVPVAFSLVCCAGQADQVRDGCVELASASSNIQVVTAMDDGSVCTFFCHQLFTIRFWLLCLR
jgi:hypothetical protein